MTQSLQALLDSFDARLKTVEAQLEIPLLRDEDGLPAPVGEFTTLGDRDSPGTFRSADGAGGGVMMAQGGGITIDATDIGLGAGWLLFLLLVVALLGKCFATRKAKRKAKRAEKKKAAEGGKGAEGV